jgi:asparagine synthase (glutamine-hydrolysing)
MGRYGWSGFLRTKRKPQYMAFAFDKQQKERIMRNSAGLKDSAQCIQSWYDGCDSDEPLDMYLQIHCRSWLTENLLWRADKMSMAESLEIRVPFLDHNLVEWAAAMPLRWRVGDKQRGYETKHVLREFVRKRLPASVDALPKRGITGPSNAWFNSDQRLGKLADKYLLAKGSAFDEIFDTTEVATILNKVRAGQGGSIRIAMHLLFLAVWLEQNA